MTVVNKLHVATRGHACYNRQHLQLHHRTWHVIDFSEALIGVGGAGFGAVLSFLVQRKDATTRAQDTAVKALTTTITQLQDHIQHLEQRMKNLETQLDGMSQENLALTQELHTVRKELAQYRGMELQSDQALGTVSRDMPTLS